MKQRTEKRKENRTGQNRTEQNREYRSSSEGDKGEEGDNDYDSDIKSGN